MQNTNSNWVIDTLLKKFEQNDMSLFEHVADDIDFAIEHYKDDADTSWQCCQSKEGLQAVLLRLAQEVFPKGTEFKEMTTFEQVDGWKVTQLAQTFWYGLLECQVRSSSIIISHEENGKIDYFREVVLGVEKR